MQNLNKLVLIGNGFDLAHGLKTSYRNFIDWYMCEAFEKFCTNRHYSDTLIEIRNKYAAYTTTFTQKPKSFEDVLTCISSTKYQSITYTSNFFQRLLTAFQANNWVDIERYYYRLLKSYFSNNNLSEKKDIVLKLNAEFDFLITQLSKYIEVINGALSNINRLDLTDPKFAITEVLRSSSDNSKTKFLNFNYTETLSAKGYSNEEDIIHIHGRVADIDRNPIIFGYGDESDATYQQIEDSGENIYLEHIKSFGYFRTNNYHKLISYIDSEPYEVSIVGHSCGLSDRVLLNEIFENANCKRIEIFYHQRSNGTDNFKEITQEISRHFKPQNKNVMRRKVGDKNSKNIIPQVV
jgi:hypothetical protein